LGDSGALRLADIERRDRHDHNFISLVHASTDILREYQLRLPRNRVPVKEIYRVGAGYLCRS
jgi:hypothetical protein